MNRNNKSVVNRNNTKPKPGRNIKKIIIVAVITAAVAAAAIIFCVFYFGGEEIYPIPSTEEELRTVMTAGGFEVSYEMLRYFANNYKSEMESLTPGIWDGGSGLEESLRKLGESITGAVRGVSAVVLLCREYGISMSESEIQAQIQSDIEAIVGEYGGFKEYQKNLSLNHLTDNLFRFLWGLDICEGELYNLMLDLGVIDEREDAVMAAIGGEDFIRVAHVFIKKEAGRDDSAGRARAEEALRALDSGEDFNKVVGRYSEDYEMTLDGYYYTRGEMETVFEEAAFALAIGEYSGVIETYQGFHIITRLEKDPVYIANHYKDLKLQHLTACFYRIVDDAKNAIVINTNSYYNSLDLLDLK